MEVSADTCRLHKRASAPVVETFERNTSEPGAKGNVRRSCLGCPRFFTRVRLQRPVEEQTIEKGEEQEKQSELLDDAR